MKTMTYEEIRPQLKTGDSISLSGRGFVSTTIKIFSGSKWSHDGMVVCEGQSIFCWESTTMSKMKDVESGTMKSGVQLVNLSKRIATYDGEIGIRPLIDPLSPRDLNTLYIMRHEVRDVPYETSLCELMKASYDGLFGLNVENLLSIFCSELKAEYYKRIGRLAAHKPANEYDPDDFARRMKKILSPMIMITA